MGLLDGLKSLFSAKPESSAAFSEEAYNDYLITPTPQREGSQYRVCGTIRKGEQHHDFVRADLLGSAEECATETLRKAKLTIDQLGDSIFR